MAFISSERLDDFRNIESLALGEIAGRDSIAAITSAYEVYNVKAIFPTVVYTGTEYGDWSILNKSLDFLKKHIKGNNILEIFFMGNPELWAALNGRYISSIYEEYGMYSPCLACHMYMHLCRVPLSMELSNAPIISGERNTHQGHVKLSQTPYAIDAYIEILSYAGIDLLLPIRHIEDNREIENIVGTDWKQGERQLTCLFSGNYYDLDKEISIDEILHKRYLDEFLIPSGKAIIDAWLNMKPHERLKIDYKSIIKKVVKEAIGVKA